MKEKKFQYSKMIPVATGLLFCVCLFKAFSIDYSSVLDVSVYASALTISGGLLGSAIIWYMKKSQAENVFKLKIELYKQASREKLHYNEQMIVLKNKYMLSEDEMMEYDDTTMDGFVDSALSDATDDLDNAMEDATSPVEVENF
jgi:hypothetical protein